MDQVNEHLIKIRAERQAREKARIEKLRDLNLKKYNKNDTLLKKSTSNLTVNKTTVERTAAPSNDGIKHVKNNFSVNGTTKKPTSISDICRINLKPNQSHLPVKDNTFKRTVDLKITDKNSITKSHNEASKNNKHFGVRQLDLIGNNPTNSKTNLDKAPVKSELKVPPKIGTSTNGMPPKPLPRKSIIPVASSGDVKIQPRMSVNPSRLSVARPNAFKPTPTTRQSILPPKTSKSASKVNPNRESVFERLYKPKLVKEKPVDLVHKLHSDPKYLNKVLKNANLIINKRHTVFDNKPTAQPPVRRSISAVHFKRIPKKELQNCMHKWSSSSDNLNKVHLSEVNEDEAVKDEKIVSAVKSERKRVKFQKPIAMNFNTPKPEELQERLRNWLLKRGKSITSYHHLQCFGLHHLAQSEKEFKSYDEEDKENIAVQADSDNDSYTENMNEDKPDDKNWRKGRCSEISSTDFDSPVNYKVALHNVDELLTGALTDLAEILREGFDWKQAARWLRAIRERYPSAIELGSYWECRAALEERQGNLPGSVQCWEEAIANGTETSVAEENLDHLLDKFMQLNISPNNTSKTEVNPRMVDVKNIFKSTVIRFAVQQAKIRQSNQFEAPKYTVTPVRRSNRLSYGFRSTPRTNRTPLLQICTSMKQIDPSLAPTFVPNETLPGTP